MAPDNNGEVAESAPKLASVRFGRQTVVTAAADGYPMRPTAIERRIRSLIRARLLDLGAGDGRRVVLREGPRLRVAPPRMRRGSGSARLRPAIDETKRCLLLAGKSRADRPPVGKCLELVAMKGCCALLEAGQNPCVSESFNREDRAARLFAPHSPPGG